MRDCTVGMYVGWIGARNEGPVYDALMAEAIACLKSLEVAEQQGI